MKRRYVLISAAVVVAGLVGTASPFRPMPVQPRPAAIGYVASMSGDWTCDGSALKVGQAVAPGGTITPAPAATADAARVARITVVLLNGVSMPCDNSKPCRPLPRSLNQTAPILTRLADVFRLLFEQPEQYSSLISRGNSPRLPDGVAALQSGRIALGPLFQGLASGHYRLTVVPAAGRTPDRGESVLTIDWDQNPQSANASTDLGAGLYKVNLGPADAGGPESWLLVTDASHFRKAHDGFADAVRVSQAWGADVAVRDVERFLHACLAQLAAGMQ